MNPENISQPSQEVPASFEGMVSMQAEEFKGIKDPAVAEIAAISLRLSDAATKDSSEDDV